MSDMIKELYSIGLIPVIKIDNAEDAVPLAKALAKAKDLTNAANETIEFAVADATTGIANSAVVNSEAHTFNLTIDAGEWAAASIAAYEGTITFTAELVDA